MDSTDKADSISLTANPPSGSIKRMAGGGLIVPNLSRFVLGRYFVCFLYSLKKQNRGAGE
jgi:hypothetical protein